MLTLENHLKSLFAGDLQSTEQFFDEKMSSGSMQAHVTTFGRRTITVEGYEGSVTISKVIQLLVARGFDCVQLELGAAERLAGLELVNKVRTLNKQTTQQLKTQNIFTRFAAKIGAMKTNAERLYAPELLFKTYNMAQFQKEFPHVMKTSIQKSKKTSRHSIEKINTKFRAMFTVDPSHKNLSKRFVEQATGRIVTDTEEVGLEVDLGTIPTSLQYTAFVLPRKEITKQLKLTRQATQNILNASQAIQAVTVSFSNSDLATAG